MINWLKETGEERDIIVSSRVRLARNLDSCFFPGRMETTTAVKVYQNISEALEHKTFQSFRLKDIPEIERNMLVEKHIISPALTLTSELSGFAMNQNESQSVLINEEDHIRIQTLTSGLSLREAWDQADELDDRLESKLNYAFDEKVGYLTACPTNLGTGLRASVMIHLPALEMTKEINKVFMTISQFGLAVRGVYGEGTKALGSLYQISNQSTLGDGEEIIIKKIENLSRQIASKERETRKRLIERNTVLLEDKIFRAYGILKHARSITADEAVRLMSLIKLGVGLELITDCTMNEIDRLYVDIQPASIQYLQRQEMDNMERDVKRAELLRNSF